MTANSAVIDRHPFETEAVAPVPAGALLDPAALAGLVLLVANDHAFKELWPGLVTGKLSDLAWLVLVPLVVMGGWEFAAERIGRHVPATRHAVIGTVLLTGVVFSLIKLLPGAGYLAALTLGAVQWPIAAAVAVTIGEAGGLVPWGTPVVFVSDPTDLIALPALAIPLRLLLVRSRFSHVGRVL